MKEIKILLVISLLMSVVKKAKADDCYYDLPYSKGTVHRTLQGFDGKYSHIKPLQYGVDFEMSEGTKVYASRGGRVFAVKDDSDKSGKDKSFIKKANYIKIAHKDGSIAFYAHLKKDGVLVKKGDVVKRNQLIGLSGCTGYCDGAHLHFEVFKEAENEHGRISIPISFWTKTGIIKKVERQKNYYAAKGNIKPCL